MNRVSSQPLLCVALFLAGCLCFLVALNPEWLSGEAGDGGPGGGGRIPGLEPHKPPAQTEETVTPETPEVPKEERKPEDTSRGKDPAASPGSR